MYGQPNVIVSTFQGPVDQQLPVSAGREPVEWVCADRNICHHAVRRPR